MLVHPPSTDLSTRTPRYLTGQLVARRLEIGTRRRLSSGPPPERGERGAHEVGSAPVGVELGDHGQVLA